MSKARHMFNFYEIDELGKRVYTDEQINIIFKRLLSVAFYDFINCIIEIKIEHLIDIKKILSILFKECNINYLLEWLLNKDNTPTKFEYILTYNIMKVDSNFIRKKLHISSSSILRYMQNKNNNLIINNKLLDNDNLINILRVLSNIEWTKFNYSIFKKIDFMK